MTDVEDRANAVERVAAITSTLDPMAQRYALRAVRESADPLQTADAVERTAIALRDTPPAAQLEGMAALGPGAPDQPTTDQLWTDIVIGLLALLGIALVGLIVMIGLGHSDQMGTLVTAFTALLTGTLGLFAPSPTGATTRRRKTT